MAHAAQAARRAGEAHVGHVEFFLACGPFLPALLVDFFPTYGNLGNHILTHFLSVLVHDILGMQLAQQDAAAVRLCER